MTSRDAALPPLRPRAARELEALRQDPGGMWDDPAWALAGLRCHAGGVELAGAACGYFELQARVRAGEGRSVWASLVAVTADDRLVLTRRSSTVAVDPDRWTVSGAEGADPTADASPRGPWDPLCAAGRVASEELATTIEGGAAAVAVHLTPEGVGVYVAGRLVHTAHELAELAPAAPDAWERAELVATNPWDPSRWPPLPRAHVAACRAAAHRLVAPR